MKHWIRKKWAKVQKGVSFLLAMAVLLTGIPFPVRAGKKYGDYLDGWKVKCAWSTLSQDYGWSAGRDEMKQPKMVVTYRLEQASRAYGPGDLQFEMEGIGGINRKETIKASDLASDQTSSEWDYVWDQERDVYTFSNRFFVEEGQSVSGGFQLLWTLQARDCVDGYRKTITPLFKIREAGEVDMEPLSFQYQSASDRYRIYLKNKKITAEDYIASDQNYIWYEIETRFDKDWLARGLKASSYYISVELPSGTDYSSVMAKAEGKTFPLEEIETESGARVWGFYPFKNRLGDLGKDYETLYKRIQLGFLKSHFSDGEETYKMVTVKGHLDRLYHEDRVWMTAAREKEKVDDQIQFTVEDYSFLYSGYVYSHKKMSYYENYPYNHKEPSYYSHRLNSTHMYDGTIVNFWLEGQAKKTYEPKAKSKRRIKSRERFSEGEMATSSDMDMNVEIPEDWNDIDWKEHGLSETENGWEEQGIRYGELYPEQISGEYTKAATSSNSNWILDEEESILSFLGGLFLKLGRKIMPEKVYASEAKGAEATPSEEEIPLASERLSEQETDYSFVMGDDKLAVYLTDGTVRNLTDEEYNMVSIQIPDMKEEYEYEIFGAGAQDTPFSEYRLMGNGVTGKEHAVALPAGVKAVFLRLNHVNGNVFMKFQVSVRLHLDWEEQKRLEEQGEAVPDHENHLINFSYVRALYRDQNGYEVNDCKAEAENYTGTYGRKLAKRDQDVYGEYLQRSYANVWLRPPVTNLSSRIYMDPLKGNQKTGFYGEAMSVGSIKTDDKISLKRFSIYTELQEGLEFVLNPEALSVRGYGKYLSGEEADHGAFREHVSYSVRKINGKNVLAADFDFSDSPLDSSGYLEVKVLLQVHLQNADFLSYGNQYTMYSYLMLHDKGHDKISGERIKNDDDDLNENGSVSEKIAYSSDKKNVYDTAAEWREYVTKQVKSAYSSKYDSSAVTSIPDGTDKSKYSYRLEFGLGSNHGKNIDFFDRIEQGAQVALNEGKPDEYMKIPSEWKGKFLSVDTSYAEKMKMKPTVYYSTDENQELTADAVGWSSVIPDNPEKVKAVWIHLDTSGMEDGLMKTRQKTYVVIHMEAPDNRAYIEKMAVNQYYVQYDAYGISGTDDFENRYELPSGATKVRLLDTVGSMIVQKSDGDHLLGMDQNGRKKYAPLQGARFQIYNEQGKPLLEAEGRMVNALGQLELSGMPFGTYYWEELTAPFGYEKIEGRHPFTIHTFDGKMEILNRRVKGEVILTKYDRDHKNKPPLSGAEFELFKSDGSQLFFTETGACAENGSRSVVKTGKDGTLKITELPWGEYYLMEVKAPDGYQKMTTPIYFSLGKNHITEKGGKPQISMDLRVYNGQKTASVRLKKIDKEDKKPLKGVVFSLYRKADEEGKEDAFIQGGLKTDETGEIQVNDLRFGTYYFVETKNLPGYYLPDRLTEMSDTVTLDTSTIGQVLEILKTNQRMTGNVTLVKKNDEGQSLSGAEYRLFYRKDPKKIYEDQGKSFVTDEKGELHASGLAWGDYYFQETKAPEGHVLSSEKLHFQVDKTTVQSEIYVQGVNQRKKGSIRLIKKDKEYPQKLLAEAEYELYKADGTKCIPGTDYVLPEGKTKILTGTDGCVVVSEISQGTYYLKETKAPPDYELSDEKLYFTVTAESAEKVQEMIAEDERSRGRIKINKTVNEVYEPFGVPAFIFRILKKDGKTKETVQTLYRTITFLKGQTEESVDILVEQGYVYEIEELEGARYRLVEITPNQGKVFTDGKKAVIDMNQQDYGEVTFKNEITQYEKLSHTSHVVNRIKTGRKLSEIKAEYRGPDPIDENTPGYNKKDQTYVIPESDLRVTAFYNDGTEQILPAGSWQLENPSADGKLSSYIGKIRYQEDGVEKEDFFHIGITHPLPKSQVKVTANLNGGTIVKDGDQTDTAVEYLEWVILEGSLIGAPKNTPKKPGYRFDGWYQDKEATVPFDFSAPMIKDTVMYAKWRESYDTKYAVSIYGINDKDADGVTIPITFGPAAGGSWVKTFVSHTPEPGERCIHTMTWTEIIEQVRKDPFVFQTCMKKGCTHSVLLRFTDDGGNELPLKGPKSFDGMMDEGDGAGILNQSVASRYRCWNAPHSEYFPAKAREYLYGTNKGGWKDSAVRNMLNGVLTDNMIHITNQNNGFAEWRFHENNCLLSCFPKELQEAIYPRAIKSDTVYNALIAENVAITRDKLWLLAFNEFFADAKGNLYSHSLEGTPFEGSVLRNQKYEQPQAWIYDETGKSSSMWIRTIFSGRNGACYVLSISNGICSGGSSGSTYGISPCFSIR